MIGLEEKSHEEPLHMTCGLLCRLCSSAGPTVSDSLSRGFSHEPSPLGRILLRSAFQVTLTLEKSWLKVVCCQRPFMLPLPGYSI
jgi:hypothetical protein